jgi:serine/threonine-protein kinase
MPAGNLLNFADRNLDVENADKNADDGYQFTAPVGSYPDGASPYGALDMAGNVWEWIADWYDGGYYATSYSQNPTGPAVGETKVLRGGSYRWDAVGVRAAVRGKFPVDYRNGSFGFRCVRSP